MAESKSDPGLKSVLVALDVLENVAKAQAEIGVSDLSAQMGLAKGVVHRHLQTLVLRGYLWQNPETSRYRAGMQCHLLGRLAAEAVDLVSASEQPMRGLRDTLGLTVTLATYKAGKTVVIERLFGTTPLEIGVRPGSEFELHATSQGKVFLAFGRKALWTALEGRQLEQPTGHSIVDLKELARQVELTKKLGWASAPEETLLGVNAVSAPIFDAKGNCVAALTVVGSIQLLTKNPTEFQTSTLKKSANSISTQLGHRG